MADIHERVRKKIRKLRTEKGFSQEKLALLADVHRAYVGQVERSEKKIGLTNLEKIATCRLSKKKILSVGFERMEKRKDTVHVRVARNIRRLRKQKGWSQEKLALQADVHRVFMGRIERCEQSPSLSTLEKIATALHIPIQDLF